VRFWDTSALGTLALHDLPGVDLNTTFEDDREIALWWGTPVEYCSIFARRVRAGTMTLAAATTARQMLDAACVGGFEVEPSAAIRASAIDLLTTYGLRAADALQLAAALAWAGSNPSGAEFVCLDRRLRDAATGVGFRVLPPDDGSIPG
jgi:predicted nucleic acid-binding protein